MSDVQEQVQKAIDELVESGAERGIQVAAYRRGELAVDAVAGTAAPATGRKVEASTPFTTTRSAKAPPRPLPTCSPSAACSDTTRRSSSCGRSSARTAKSG